MANCTPIIEAVLDGNGNPQNFPVPPPVLSPVGINAAGGFPLTLVAATSGLLTRLYGLVLVADAATTITFMDGATNLAPVLKMSAGETITLSPHLHPWFQGSVDTDFKMNSSAAVQLTGGAYVNLNAV